MRSICRCDWNISHKGSQMRGGLGFCLANALLLLGMAAHADPTLPDLRTLPSIGTAKPQTNLRWGMGRAQLHSLYPGLSPTSFSIGLYSVQGVAAYRGCTFTLRLDSGLNPGPDGRLQSARLQYLTGNLQTCSRGLESTLTLLYGPPQITKHPTGCRTARALRPPYSWTGKVRPLA